MDLDNIDLVDIVDEVDIEVNVRIPRQIYVRQNYFDLYSDLQFFTRFRLQKLTCLFLLNQIEDQLEFINDR